MFVVDSGDEADGKDKPRKYTLDGVVLKIISFVEPSIQNQDMHNLKNLS